MPFSPQSFHASHAHLPHFSFSHKILHDFLTWEANVRTLSSWWQRKNEESSLAIIMGEREKGSHKQFNYRWAEIWEKKEEREEALDHPQSWTTF